MITLFTVPKPFIGHIDTIQRNALSSWTFLRPECETLLFGDEVGTAEVCSEFRLQQIAEVGCNEYGTPLVSDIFQTAQALARHPVVGYVNADIILMDDFLEAVARVVKRKRRFLMVGRRWDLRVDGHLDFGPHWQERLRAHLVENGELHPPTGTDFFVFPRGMLRDLPPFVVGRPVWDNWLLYKARKLGIAVIDVTKAVSVVHQNHDHRHVPNRSGEAWEGPEADYNRQLMGSRDHLFELIDATHILTPRTLSPAIGYKYLLRRCRTLPILNVKMRILVQFLGRLKERLNSDRGRVTL